MNLFRNLSFVFLALIYTGCASSYLIPSARMLSPESEGQLGLTLETGTHEIHRVYITHDITNTSVLTSAHNLDEMITQAISGTFGIFDSFDVGLDYEIGIAPMVFGKLQLWGDSRRTALPGNTSFALVVSTGYDMSFDDNDSSGLSNPGDVRRNGHGIYEAGGVWGYRTSAHAVLIFGGSVLWQEISGAQYMHSGATPIYFDDHSRYTEFHFGSIVNFNPNTGRSFFITPMLQWGWVDTFGTRDYVTSISMNFGYQFK